MRTVFLDIVFLHTGGIKVRDIKGSEKAAGVKGAEAAEPPSKRAKQT